MKSQRVIVHREQSHPAYCTEPIYRGIRQDGRHFVTLCGAQMRLEIKEPRWWSYQIRVSERCALNHISHGQAVLDV